MTAHQTKIRLILLSLVSLALVALLVLDFYQIRAKNEETSRLTNLLDKGESMEILTQAIRNLQNNSWVEFETFQQLTLTNDSLVPLIESLENTGRSLGLTTKIISINKSGDPEAPEPQKIQMVVESSGTWRGTFLFLKAIESVPYRVMFEGVELAQSTGLWRARVTLSLYAFK